MRLQEKYLVCKRPPNKRHGGLWEFPGGKLEPGEDYFSAARRELSEELVVEVLSVDKPIFLIEDPGSDFLIAFAPTTIRGEPTCVEHSELKWLTLEELSSVSLAPSDHRFVEYLNSR